MGICREQLGCGLVNGSASNTESRIHVPQLPEQISKIELFRAYQSEIKSQGLQQINNQYQRECSCLETCRFQQIWSIKESKNMNHKHNRFHKHVLNPDRGMSHRVSHQPDPFGLIELKLLRVNETNHSPKGESQE